MRVLVFGASGMLGNALVRVLSEMADWQVFGTLRSAGGKTHFTKKVADRLISGVDVEQDNSLVEAFTRVRPQFVVNCVGLVKQLADANDPLKIVPINSLLPHRLSRLCELSGARLAHISTDCVFSGKKGGYRESDFADAEDLYGRSKYLGEVSGTHAITLRTSVIGHELQSAHGLVDWFLSQKKQCQGYNRAIFSGLPTVVLAKIIRDVVVPAPALHGLYHVAAEPISKYDLLRRVAKIYGKDIEIVPNDEVSIDRSLNADRFHDATGYSAPQWDDMIGLMRDYR